MQIRAIRSLCYTLVIALLTTLTPAPFTQPASAQLMPTYSVGVIDFANESGVQGELLARLATDAVVVEMSKSNRYDVSITRTMMQAKMDELGIRSPMTKIDLIRLGEALSADAMMQGSVRTVQLSGSGPNRRASVTLVAQMIDQASGEIINGAAQTGTSTARVGYTADDNALIAEAINAAAYLTVRTMVDYVIPEATVMMNVGDDKVMINKGVRAGIKPGMRMIVLRNREIIGYLQVTTTAADDAFATVLKSVSGIQPEDKARAIYDMPTVSAALKSESLPSGAPKKDRIGSGVGGKMVKLFVTIGVLVGLGSLFQSGRGVSDSPKAGMGKSNLEFTWNPKQYDYGNSVYELQIVRDAGDAMDGTAPVFWATQDVGLWNQGSIDLSKIYPIIAPRIVAHSRMASGASTPSATSSEFAPEGYGERQHTYRLRVILRSRAGESSEESSGTTYKYEIPNFSKAILATAIQPVTRDRVVSPVDGDLLFATELLDGTSTLKWMRSDMVTRYRVIVEPVTPGAGPVWSSGMISNTGDAEVSISDADRLSLARALNNSIYNDVVMRWRVEAQNEADSNKAAWTSPEEFETPRFVIGPMPPGTP